MMDSGPRALTVNEIIDRQSLSRFQVRTIVLCGVVLVLEGFDAAGQPILRAAKWQITVRHLLTHTLGYTYSIWSDAITRYEQGTGMPDIRTCQNAAFTTPLEFEPGERSTASR